MDRRVNARGILRQIAISAGIAAVTLLTPGAHAADLGGNCCADLEERIAELEVTTSRKGNRKVSLLIGMSTAQLSFSKGSFAIKLSPFDFVTTVTPGTAAVISGSSIAVLDTSSFTHEERASRSVFNSVDQTVSGLLDGTIACAASSEESGAAANTQCTRRGVWAAGIGGYADIDATGSAFSAEQTLIGGLAGAHADAAPGITLGMFGGYAETDLETEFDAELLETRFGIAGAFARLRIGQAFADATVTGVWSNTDRSREIASNIGGIGQFETATANANGWMVSPTLTFGWRLPVADGITLVPAAKLRGTFGQHDGFAESGSTANFSADARDVANVDARLELGVLSTFAAGSGLSVSVRAQAGLSYVDAFGDDTIVGRLLGQSVSFSNGAAVSEFGGYIGVGLDVPLSASASLFGDTELLLTERAQEITGFGGVKVKF